MTETYTLVGYPDRDPHTGEMIADAPETTVRTGPHHQHQWDETTLFVSPRVAARVRRALNTDQPQVWIANRLIRCHLSVCPRCGKAG